MERPARSVVPDIHVSQLHVPAAAPEPDGSQLAILEQTDVDTEVVEVVPGYEVRELSLEIHTGGAGRDARLVTVIELLSPSNKAAGSEGRIADLGKQTALLTRDVHLIEIDLLRGGEHTTALPRESLKRPLDYHIAVRDLNLPPTRRYSYPIRLEDRLPKLAVPLLKGEGDLTVELQPVFDRCYDTGSYRREIDYLAEQPDPPLDEARSRWARECIDRWLNPPPA